MQGATKAVSAVLARATRAAHIDGSDAPDVMVRVIALTTSAGTSLDNSVAAFHRVRSSFGLTSMRYSLFARPSVTATPTHETLGELVSALSWSDAGAGQLREAADLLARAPEGHGRNMLTGAVQQATQSAARYHGQLSLINEDVLGIYNGRLKWYRDSTAQDQFGRHAALHVPTSASSPMRYRNVDLPQTDRLHDFQGLAATASLADHKTAAIRGFVGEQQAALDTLEWQIRALPAPQLGAPQA